ncbi:ATP-dependent dethiobiotin synthetase BioD [Nocardia farcinica]|uniref:dethiobiotin synthase n=1 Tax=Nocardia farcinica TaxID=37329 RepID=UPI001894754A|nr:dethiobiotin synthase [Nocardia farcinica]MBF6364059.1 ATP-dependent dethiobiotin synthetase BioD [Nocardia farcinica]
MNTLLVTGTSTDVGKTVVTAALTALARAEGLAVAVCKPAQTGVAPGEPGDLAEVRRLAGPVPTLELARYPEPLAPDTAARRCGAPLLTLDETATAVRGLDAELTVVEGAGGLLVRVGEFTLLDLARELDAPVLVVAAAGLGTLNHTELTIRALDAAGVRCAGVVIGTWPAEPDLASLCNREDLPRLTGVPIVGAVPAGVGAWDHDRFTAAVPGWFAPGWSPRLPFNSDSPPSTWGFDTSQSGT